MENSGRNLPVQPTSHNQNLNPVAAQTLILGKALLNSMLLLDPRILNEDMEDLRDILQDLVDAQGAMQDEIIKEMSLLMLKFSNPAVVLDGLLFLNIVWTPYDGEATTAELEQIVALLEHQLSTLDQSVRCRALGFLACRVFPCRELISAIISNQRFLTKLLELSFEDYCVNTKINGLKLLFGLIFYSCCADFRRLLCVGLIPMYLPNLLLTMRDLVTASSSTAVLGCLRSASRSHGPMLVDLLRRQVTSSRVLHFLKPLQALTPDLQAIKTQICDGFDCPDDFDSKAAFRDWVADLQKADPALQANHRQ